MPDSQGPALIYDRDVAERFLQAFGPDELFMFQTFDNDEKRKDKTLARQYYGNLPTYLDQLAALNSRRAGIYITVNRCDGKGRTAKNIISVRALFIDLDGTPLPQQSEWHLPPSIVTESSAGRYQVFWFVPDCPLEQFTAVQKRLSTLYHSDPKVCDLPRVMRLPGFMHHKYKPYMSRVLHVSSMTYDFEHFIKRLPPEQQPKQRGTARDPDLGHHKFHDLNQHALANLDVWVPILFPKAVRSSLGWRVSSISLGRKLQEDISLTADGIVDFGVADQGDNNEGKRSPIDLVREWNRCDFRGAVTWLHRILGLPAPVWEEDQNRVQPRRPIKLSSLFPINEQNIPRRPWIIPGLLLRRHLTLTAAPGGTGKSVLTLCVAVMLAMGKVWAGWSPRSRYRVLVINAEEDREEMQRRGIGVAMRSLGVSNTAELTDLIYVADNPSDIVVARYNARNRTMTREPLADQLMTLILSHKFDVVIVDPFAETFMGEETNTELKWVGALWRDIARQTNTAIWLIHHTKKYANDMAGDIEASRGGTALGNIARIGTTMFPMTANEAGAMGVPEEERRNYVRFDDAKANYHMLGGHAQWFKSETVYLQNSEGDMPGDNVGVFEPWAPPVASITDEQLTPILHKIDAGIDGNDGKPLGEYYTLNNKQKSTDSFNRWVGLLIAEEFKCREQQAKQIVDNWRRANIIVEFQYRSPSTRKMVWGCGSPAKRQRMNQKPSAQEDMFGGDK
jgi:hypothetical protein